MRDYNILNLIIITNQRKIILLRYTMILVTKCKVRIKTENNEISDTSILL